MYTPVSEGSGWTSGGGGWTSVGGGGHKSKSSALSMSALTLLAFLFFINMLQTCLKEQMTSLNPTVCFKPVQKNAYMNRELIRFIYDSIFTRKNMHKYFHV